MGVCVGADPACDVVLADAAVSARHATIVPRDGAFEITDLGSRNGTWLEGVSLRRASVPLGTTLRLGTTLVQLLPAEQPAELEPSTRSSFGALVGGSLPMRRVYALLERASSAQSPLLLLGESGTGKELAARAVHAHGPRRAAPFVVFDCGAASEALIESQLFGHKRGAFTGADADRRGAFAAADGGAIFLDEIGDLPLAVQPKLLRLVERGEVTPLGAERPERYDVNVIAATHRDLWAEVGRGTFRGDLYYRLAVIEVRLPALRERLDDVVPLTRALLAAHGFRGDVPAEGPAMQRLAAYGWPGNVRELRNVVARAVALSPMDTPFDELPLLLRSAVAPPSHEPLVADAGRPYHEAKSAAVARFDAAYLERSDAPRGRQSLPGGARGRARAKVPLQAPRPRGPALPASQEARRLRRSDPQGLLGELHHGAARPPSAPKPRCIQTTLAALVAIEAAAACPVASACPAPPSREACITALCPSIQ